MPVLYVRVRDPKSKQEWDEPQGSPLIRKGLVEVIKGNRYPPSRSIRPTKRPPVALAARGGSKPKPAGEGAPTENKE